MTLCVDFLTPLGEVLRDLIHIFSLFCTFLLRGKLQYIKVR
jgi:hypothetical protein